MISRKIINVSNTCPGITFPKGIAQAYGLTKGTLVGLYPTDQGIFIRRIEIVEPDWTTVRPSYPSPQEQTGPTNQKPGQTIREIIAENQDRKDALFAQETFRRNPKGHYLRRRQTPPAAS